MYAARVRKSFFFALACFVLACDLSAQRPRSPEGASNGAADQWQKLINANQITTADKLCTSWVGSPDMEKQVEAQKCLANVALAGGSSLAIEGNEVGGGTIGQGYTREAVDQALAHLNAGLQLAPQDVSLHQGRLHVLEVSGRYDEMAKALDESITIYKGPDTPGIWLAYAAELGDDGEPTAGLRISEVLGKYYPNNSDVIGNLGAFHSILKEWDKALPYLRKAVELNPQDPIDTWNLGWALDHLNQTDDANQWMAKSLELDSSSSMVPERKCLYGQFLITKMKRKAEGCALVTKACEDDEKAACVGKTTAAVH